MQQERKHIAADLANLDFVGMGSNDSKESTALFAEVAQCVAHLICIVGYEHGVKSADFFPQPACAHDRIELFVS